MSEIFFFRKLIVKLFVKSSTILLAVVFLMLIVVFNTIISLPKLRRLYNVDESNLRYLSGTQNCLNVSTPEEFSPTFGKTSIVKRSNPEKKSYTVGDVVQYTIYSRGENNLMKNHGGDLYVIRGFTEAQQAHVAGEVYDNEDGSYSAFLLLPWSGPITVEIRLIANLETRVYLETLRNENFHENTFTEYARFRSEESLEFISQSCERDGVERGEICNLSEFHVFFEWTCTKPAEVDCKDYVPELHFSGVHHPEFCGALINNSGDQLVLPEPKQVNVGNDAQDSIKGHLNEISSKFVANYFYGGKYWSQRLYPFRSSNVQPRLSCMKDGTFIFIGDSNARNAYSHLISLYADGKNVPVVAKGRSGTHQAGNVTLRYLAFGHSSVGTPDGASVMRPLQYLDREVSSTTISVYISIWAHITFFHLDKARSLYETLRDTIGNIRKVYPSVKFIIRLPHLRETDAISHRYRHHNYYAYTLLKLIREIFQETEVHFINMWDIVVAKGGSYAIHPSGIAFTADMDEFTAIVCPPEVVQKR